MKHSNKKNSLRSQEEKKSLFKKIQWKPGTLLAPVPVVLVSCKGEDSSLNIITIAWTGIICSDPPMLHVAIRPERHSYQLIKDTKEFVVNIPSVRETRFVDFCGVVSGKKIDKFIKCGFTPGKAVTIKSPIILECPINIECKVKQTIPLGSHVLFLANITAVQVSENLIDKRGRLAIEKAKLITYAHGHYYKLGKQIGHFGFSVRKKVTRRSAV